VLWRTRAPVCLLCKFFFNNPVCREFFASIFCSLHLDCSPSDTAIVWIPRRPLTPFFGFIHRFDGFWLLLKVINEDEFVSGASAVAIWTHQAAASWLIALIATWKAHKRSASCISCNAKKLKVLKISHFCIYLYIKIVTWNACRVPRLSDTCY